MRFQWFVVDNNGNKQVEWIEPRPQSIEDIKFENERLKSQVNTAKHIQLENEQLKEKLQIARSVIIELQNEIKILRGEENGCT